LLQVVDIVASIINAPEWVSQSILLVLGIGFPIAIFFAWAFELTPDGIKREKDVDRTQSITGRTGRRLDYTIIGVLVVAVAWLGFDKLALDTPSEPGEIVAAVTDESPSIAVLPFTNMSADADSAYFSDGLADTLLHMLAQIKELRVAARTSSFQFRDQSMDVADIGKQLNVATLLEGSVQRSGDKIRITAQLIDVSNGYHLWSGNFDRELNDVFAIQDEIATEVVNALKLSLLGESTENLQMYATENVEAYTQYLLALNDLGNNTFDSYTSAVNHLQSAIEIDPEYAPAYASLARVFFQLQRTGAIGRDEGIADARVAATRALDLSPNSPEALSVLGLIELDNGNNEVAEHLLLKAIENGPNYAPALRNYSQYLFSETRLEESMDVLQQAIRLDPLSLSSHILLTNGLSLMRRFDEAAEAIKRIQEINAQSPYGPTYESYINQLQGNWAAATQLMEQATALDPNDPEISVFVGDLYLGLGLLSEAGQWYDRATEIFPGHPVSLSRPLILNWIVSGYDKDDIQQARKLLEEKIENRWGSRAIPAYLLLDDAERTGDYTALLETLDNLHPQLFDDPPAKIADDPEMTFFVGRALVQSGQTERGFQLLDAWSNDTEKLEAVIGFSTNSIEIDLLRGDKQAALEKLRARDSMKYDIPMDRFYFARDSLWQTLSDEPQFVELVEHLDQHADEQRVILQAMEE
jgi:TolB-like protein/cytochrome c-type biogenesis protein CcmH/NrfG